MADSPNTAEEHAESPWWLPVRGRFDYLTGAGMALTGIFVVAAAALAAMAVGNAATEPTGPARAEAERESYQRDQTIRLASYRWVDEEAGLVVVPIEVAKAVVVRRGVAPIAIGAAEPETSEPATSEPEPVPSPEARRKEGAPDE